MKLIEVDRSEFKVIVWVSRPTGFAREKVYKVAIGATGFETPVGAYSILTKARDPDWKMPDSEWVAKDDRGKIIPGGSPENPLKAAFLGVTRDGVGFHGTANDASIGTAASHGCIRMHVPDVLDFYGRVGVGVPVVIHD